MTMWNRDCTDYPDLNLYGSHPFLLEVRPGAQSVCHLQSTLKSALLVATTAKLSQWLHCIPCRACMVLSAQQTLVGHMHTTLCLELDHMRMQDGNPVSTLQMGPRMGSCCGIRMAWKRC